MNKALQELKDKVKDTALYKLSINERIERLEKCLEKMNLSKEDYEYIKKELDKIRGRVME